MKNKLLAVVAFFLFCGVVSADEYSRLGVPRSSFTDTADVNVLIASAGVTQGEAGYGGIILRYVACSGVVSSTITVFNSMVFDGNSSTVTKFVYVPRLDSSLNAYATSAEHYTPARISSALSYDKQGLAPCVIGWDYTVIPRYGGVQP